MLAIHNSSTGFHPRWIEYCERNGIWYKRVDCYSSDIIQQLDGCRALMWHHGQSNPKDILVARPILSAVEHAGIKIFPDFLTAWHFDDKVAQKYLFEALDIPAVPAHVFVDRDQALIWVTQAEFPQVFKLRRGAGSAGVKLVTDGRQARRLVKKAFGRGFRIYDPWDSLKERVYKWRLGKFPVKEILKGLARFFYPPRYSRILGRESGYIYFQDFLPGNAVIFVLLSSGTGPSVFGAWFGLATSALPAAAELPMLGEILTRNVSIWRFRRTRSSEVRVRPSTLSMISIISLGF